VGWDWDGSRTVIIAIQIDLKAGVYQLSLR
jgi:hypothetical protein